MFSVPEIRLAIKFGYRIGKFFSESTYQLPVPHQGSCMYMSENRPSASPQQANAYLEDMLTDVLD